jgi:hypothetical protein
MPTAVWSHNTTVYKATCFTLFRLMYGAEAMLPEEIKHRSLWAAAESTTCPNEVEEKDLLESDRLKEVTNLEKYQTEIRAWRDPKVKLKNSRPEIWCFYEAPERRTQSCLRQNGHDLMW